MPPSKGLSGLRANSDEAPIRWQHMSSCISENCSAMRRMTTVQASASSCADASVCDESRDSSSAMARLP